MLVTLDILFAIAGAANLGIAPVAGGLALLAACALLLLWRDRGQPAPMLGTDLFRIPGWKGERSRRYEKLPRIESAS